MQLNHKQHYLQVAFNNTLDEATDIIRQLPDSSRIILEAGTPLIKRYGTDCISTLRRFWYLYHTNHDIYIVADMKTMDRGSTEVDLVANGGGNALIMLGQSPIETINAAIEACKKRGIDSMVDMMNVDQPVKILRKLNKLPDVVILHRGVDEEAYNKSKPIPYLQINKIRATSDVMIAVAGGDTIREVQRAIFNDANIVVVWKEFYQAQSNTKELAEAFLREIK